MKKLFRKKFLGIPVAVIAIILVAAVAGASVLLTSTQTITQEILPAPPPTYTLNTAVEPDRAAGHITVTSLGGVDLNIPATVIEGTVLNIEAKAGALYQFVEWTAPAGTFLDADAATTTFTMPSQDVTVTANFELIPDYGSIETPDFALPNVLAGAGFWAGPPSPPGTATVVVGPDGVGMYLHVTLDTNTTGSYTKFAVSFNCPRPNPMDTIIGLGVNSYGDPENSLQLTEAGTYNFNVSCTGNAGMTPGSQAVKVFVTLEDAPAP